MGGMATYGADFSKQMSQAYNFDNIEFDFSNKTSNTATRIDNRKNMALTNNKSS